jgi:hypothetical protein
MRAYVTGCSDKESVGRLTPVETTFSLHAEAAYVYSLSKEQAEDLCRHLDSYEIKVNWAEGGEHVCKNFQIEERAQGFALFCDGPFTYAVPASRLDNYWKRASLQFV